MSVLRRAVRLRGERATALVAAIVVIAAGYFVVFRAFDDRIATRAVEIDTIAETLAGNALWLARRPQLERDAGRLDRRLRAVSLDVDRATLVARFVRDTARIARTHHVVVIGIDGAHTTAARAPLATTSASPAAGAAAENVGRAAFDVVPLDMTFAGRYGDLLATVADLARGAILARIELRSIERTQAPRGPGPLVARLHAGLNRLAPHLSEGHHVLPSSP